jgi:hypothetical protein
MRGRAHSGVCWIHSAADYREYFVWGCRNRPGMLVLQRRHRTVEVLLRYRHRQSFVVL